MGVHVGVLYMCLYVCAFAPLYMYVCICCGHVCV